MNECGLGFADLLGLGILDRWRFEICKEYSNRNETLTRTISL